MALFNRLNDNLKTALKSQNQTQVITLRLLLSAIHNKEIEKKHANSLTNGHMQMLDGAHANSLTNRHMQMLDEAHANSLTNGHMQMLDEAQANSLNERAHANGMNLEISDEEIIILIKREAKKRKEAIDIYKQGGREELAIKEAAELKILEEYLPPQVSEAEIETIVKAVVAELKPTSPPKFSEEKLERASEKDFGRIMKEAMARLKGKADAGLVSQMVRRCL